jgi:hypothetical protein
MPRHTLESAFLEMVAPPEGEEVGPELDDRYDGAGSSPCLPLILLPPRVSVSGGAPSTESVVR